MQISTDGGHNVQVCKKKIGRHSVTADKTCLKSQQLIGIIFAENIRSETYVPKFKLTMNNENDNV